MKKIISLSILTALLSLLTACGVKGPLYFPAEEPQQNQQSQQPIQNQQTQNQTQQK
ncbi:putative small lipoprotein YifL [Pasteurella langaaensis DSM 22999]|uniref:Putative small lipoprotein YifL n=1 Tax=Alitibacter langaaensis DSM 22999 TaxID=1122935 RepID=A0A2U0SM51_9PAST|nr:putative small lipoprotein YifL [Pasteurella langaaensis DSM 22999]